MRFVKASERLPEFVNKNKKYVVRYVRIPDEMELWIWDWINEREAAEYDFEWLDESLPASIEQEAETLYPDLPKDLGTYTGNILSEAKRSAHITCARQYMGEIEMLRAENSKMRKALEEIAQKYADAEVLDDIGQFVFEMGELATEALK